MSDTKLLVVDDTAMHRRIFTQLFADRDIHVTQASCGSECLEHTAKENFDIIFIDRLMPEMDGFEVLAAIRSQENGLCRETPAIIMATQKPNSKDITDAGFIAWLEKPIDPLKLDDIVLDFIDNSHGEEKDGTEKYRDITDLPVTEGVDWRYAQQHFSDMPSLLATLQIFLKTLSREADELDRLYAAVREENGFKNYCVKVHSMKSSAALVGIIQLAGMAMCLEHAAKHDDIDVIDNMHWIFIRQWNSYSGLLREFMPKNSAAKEAAEFTDEINDLFEQLRKAAADMDIDALDDIGRRLDEYHFTGEKADRIAEIKTGILNFEIEKLMECRL